MRRPTAIAALAALALPLPGCGGGARGPAPTRTRFAAAAEAICAFERQRVEFITRRAGVAPGAPPPARLIRKQVAQSQLATSRLEGLPRPPAEERQIGRWLTARTVAATVALDLAEAPPGEDAAAARDVLGELLETRSRARGLARSYGLQACGDVD